MFRPYFEAAAKFLKSQGVSCGIYEGRKLSDLKLAALPMELGLHIPHDLTAYWRELGDGFSIQWELPKNGGLVCFALSFLEDIQQEHLWLQEQLREVCDTQPDETAGEARRRLNWLPIIGIGEGGNEWCLDTCTEPAAIRY